VVAGTSYGKLTDYDRQSEKSQKNQINDDKSGTAVLSAYIREFPDIPKTYRTSGGYKNKAQSGTE
jgi:hypothetical protein